MPRLSSAGRALCLLSVYRATHLRAEWPAPSSRLINKNAEDSTCVFFLGASHLPPGPVDSADLQLRCGRFLTLIGAWRSFDLQFDANTFDPSEARHGSRAKHAPAK